MVQHSIHSSIIFSIQFKFFFCAHSLAAFIQIITFHQNHPGTKHLCWDFCPTFAGIPPVSRGIPSYLDRMKSVSASYKHNIIQGDSLYLWRYILPCLTFIRKLLYTYHTVYRPAFCYTSRFPFKQPVNPLIVCLMYWLLF